MPSRDVQGLAHRSVGNTYFSPVASSREGYLDPQHPAAYASPPIAASRATSTVFRDDYDIPSDGHILGSSLDGTSEAFRGQATFGKNISKQLSDTERSRHPPSPFGDEADEKLHLSGASSPRSKRPRLDLASSRNAASEFAALGSRRSQEADSTHRRTGRSRRRQSAAGLDANGERSNSKRLLNLRSFGDRVPSCVEQGRRPNDTGPRSLHVYDLCSICAITDRHPQQILPLLAGLDMEAILPEDGGTTTMSVRTTTGGGGPLKRTYQACIRYVCASIANSRGCTHPASSVIWLIYLAFIPDIHSDVERKNSKYAEL
jgi:hypothetical protein